MKKILVSVYCEKNLGDDLFLKVLFDRYKDVEWHILDCNKEYKNIFSNYNVKNIKFIHSRLFSIFKHFIKYDSYDAYIYIGGSIFMQLSEWKKQLKERQYIINKFINKKVFIIGSNFGPYDDDNFKNEYEKLFEKCTDVCFRDEYSYNIFKKLKNVRVAPDVVFQLENSIEDTNKKNILGISVINLENRKKLKKYTEQYEHKIKEIVQQYVDIGYDINLFSFCKKEGDEVVIARLMESIDEKYKSKINIVKYDGDINLFIEKFKSCKLIIGTRFHSIILSQLFNQGLYPLIYSDKSYNILKDMKLNSHYCYIRDIEQLNVDEIKNVINNNKVNDRDIINQSKKQFRELDKFILKI